MKLRKSLAALSMGVMVAAAAAGCTNSSSASSSPQNGGSLTVWSMWAKGEPGADFMQSLADDFQKQTGIKVTVVDKGRNPGKQILPSLNTDNVPADIVESNNGDLVAQLGPTGNLADLSDVYSGKITGSSDSQTVGQTLGDYRVFATPVTGGGPLMVPYWANTYAMFYNAKTHPEIVDSPPKTWNDFLKVLDAVKKDGRAPLALDGSIPGYNGYYIQYFTLAQLGSDSWKSAILDKSGQTWLQPGYLEAAKHVEALAKGGYFINGYDSSKFPAMEQKWANNQADFIMMGTWLPTEVAKAAAPGLDPRTFAFPAVSDKGSPALDASVGGMAVLNKSKNLDNAKKFVSFVLNKQYQQTLSTQLNYIPVRNDVAAPAAFQGIKKELDAGNFNKNLMTADGNAYLAKVLYPLNDQLVFGKITAEQYITSLAKASQQYWASTQ